MSERTRLVIIGGGWAGIAAAVEAVERGRHVTLVEERQYLGGRAHSFIDKHTSTEIDNGQHLLMGCYHQTLSILKKLNTHHLLEWQRALRVVFVDVNGKRSVLDASKLPGIFGVAAGILRLQSLPLSSRFSIIRFALMVLLNRIQPGDATCMELLNKHGQPIDAINAFWKPLILATLNSPLETADSGMLIAVMKLAFFSGGENSKLILPATTLGDLTAPVTSWIAEHGGAVLLKSRAESFAIQNGRITHVTLNDGTTIATDAVVTCIPVHALKRLLPSAGISDFEVSPIVNVYLWYSQPWLDEPFVAMVGTLVQWVFNKDNRQGQLVAITISAASDVVGQDSDTLITRCDEELRNAFPSMTGSVLQHGLVLKEKTATPLFKPDERSKRVVDYGLLPENIGIAGDWTNTGLPATIEGAARSGVAAIQRVLQNQVRQ
ncbi:MAG: FAD-dependent oxidoreductase [Ignavibacteria bacterium]|nr:FAD-dependent oxidoreductase [Ignavibacteria bacterium]